MESWGGRKEEKSREKEETKGGVGILEGRRRKNTGKRKRKELI